MQKQTIPTNKSTQNNPIKMFVIVLLLSSLLFIIVSLITLAHSLIILPINYFYKHNFYGLNIDLVYTTCHIDIRKYLDSMCTLYHNLLYQ